MTTERPTGLLGDTPRIDAFLLAWGEIHAALRDWLATKRFPAQPNDVAAVFEEASAEVRKDDWAACKDPATSSVVTKGSVALRAAQGEAIKKLMMSAFSRAVRAIEIRKWSQLILEEDRIPAGPLQLPPRWRERLPDHWKSDIPRVTKLVNESLSELARAGWAALGAYGTRVEPSKWFLEQLLARLRQGGTWENVLYSSYSAEGVSLVEAFRRQALHEFNSTMDGERALEWAINFLIDKKFPDMRPVHEVTNPQGYLRTSFATALVEFRRQAWNPGQLQRPRPEKWVGRELGNDWVDVFRLVVEHARTEEVVHQFLAGERVKPEPDDELEDSKAGRMTARARIYLAQARQIDECFRDDKVARIRAMATLWRSYLEHVKKWFPVMPALSLHISDNDGGEREFESASVDRDPLMELLCAADRHRLRGMERIAGDVGADGKEPALLRVLLGRGFELSIAEVGVLRNILDPPPVGPGRPRKDVAKAMLLERLKAALQDAGIDASILDSVSVWFQYQGDFDPGDGSLAGTDADARDASLAGDCVGAGGDHDPTR